MKDEKPTTYGKRCCPLRQFGTKTSKEVNIYVITFTKADVLNLFTLFQIKEKYEPLLVSLVNVCCMLCVPF